MKPTQKKVRLDLDRLAVESFATDARQTEERGTVHAQMRPNSDWTDCSLDTVCNGPTNWDYTCVCP